VQGLQGGRQYYGQVLSRAGMPGARKMGGVMKRPFVISTEIIDCDGEKEKGWKLPLGEKWAVDFEKITVQ
jgi:hypothetical protein